MPKRIQRKRSKGWRMPENTVYVGRPSRWGNWFPFYEFIQDGGDLYSAREKVRDLFEDNLEEMIGSGDCLPINGEDLTIEEWLAPLRGKDLACWCPLDHPCHADVLLRLANKACSGRVGFCGIFEHFLRPNRILLLEFYLVPPTRR